MNWRELEATFRDIAGSEPWQPTMVDWYEWDDGRREYRYIGRDRRFAAAAAAAGKLLDAASDGAATWGARLVECAGRDNVLIGDGWIQGKVTDAARVSAELCFVLAAESTATEAAPAAADATEATNDDEGTTLARALAVADPDAARILTIAADKSLSADDRMRAIANTDRRFYGKTSGELAAILGTTDGNVRKTRWWKVDRVNYIAKQDE